MNGVLVLGLAIKKSFFNVEIDEKYITFFYLEIRKIKLNMRVIWEASIFIRANKHMSEDSLTCFYTVFNSLTYRQE